MLVFWIPFYLKYLLFLKTSYIRLIVGLVSVDCGSSVSVQLGLCFGFGAFFALLKIFILLVSTLCKDVRRGVDILNFGDSVCFLANFRVCYMSIFMPQFSIKYRLSMSAICQIFLTNFSGIFVFSGPKNHFLYSKSSSYCFKFDKNCNFLIKISKWTWNSTIFSSKIYHFQTLIFKIFVISVVFKNLRKLLPFWYTTREIVYVYAVYMSYVICLQNITTALFKPTFNSKEPNAS